MPTQYNRYSSSDAAGPGLLTGQAGKLIALLKACLVDGYAGHAAPSPAWTQPVATAGNIGSFKAGAGSQMSFVLNDNGENVTSTFKEAWITGWESVAGVASPVGSGSGQFPTPAQQLVTGHGVIRKSNTADATGRAWFLFADSYNFILFTAPGDTVGAYSGYYFGDIFSLKGATDTYRTALIAKSGENGTDAEPLSLLSAINASCLGHFMPRTFGGGGTSITIGKHGNASRQSSATVPDGLIQTPNGPDTAYYFEPVWVHENSANIIRGRLRGLYWLLHPSTSFADGQTFDGAGDYAGKSFIIMKSMRSSSFATGILIVETSATVEVN